MKNKKKKLMVSAIAGAMAATMVIGGGTFAYLQSHTSTVKNEFKTEEVKVEISETPQEYDIIPGTEQDKDPKLTITNSLESFLYVKVTDNTYGLVTYEIADGWTKLEGYDDIYYRKVAADLDTNGNAKPQEFYILKNNKVSYDKDLISDDMLDENGDLLKDVALSFEGFAIQAQPFTDAAAGATAAPTEMEAAVAAYNKSAPKRVSNASGLKQALADVENGGVIKLDSDITATDLNRIGGNKKFTLDLDGHTLDLSAKTLLVDNANVTIKDGTLHSDKTAIQFAPSASGDGHLVIGSDAKIVSDSSCAVLVADRSNGTNSGVLDIYGETEGNIFIHGTINNLDIVVNIYGHIDGGDNVQRGDIGVGLNGNATVNVKNGAIVESLTGIEVRAGKLNVEDGATIIGKDTPASFEPNASGTTTTGAAIGVSQHTTKLPINVNITGGTMKAFVPLYEVNPQNNSAEDLSKITINVTGGTFENINGGTTKFSIADRDKINYTNSLE